MGSCLLDLIDEGFGERGGVFVDSLFFILESENRHPVVSDVAINLEFAILIAAIFDIFHGAINVLSDVLFGKFGFKFLAGGVM